MSGAKSTLEVAEALGKVRKRTLAGRPGSDPPGETGGCVQPLSFALVIDFESTCWPREANRRGDPNPPPEVIEFPAVLLRMRDGEVVDEFHTFVLPTEQPRLSEFCVELTGIDQDELESSGVPLWTALTSFSRWLRSAEEKHDFLLNRVEEGRALATVVTWSDWDINVCLSLECRRKQLSLPAPLRAWCDLRLLYARHYRRRPQGLAGALRDLGIAFQGREHSGLCDARNTAMLAARMARDGCRIGVTRTCRPAAGAGAAGAGPDVHQRLRANLSLAAHKSSVAAAAAAAAAPQTKVRRCSITPPTGKVSSFRRTPPMCNCGKRARLLTAQKPGPNQGRSFFSCHDGGGRSSGPPAKGCKFFQWEDAGSKKKRLSVRPGNSVGGETPKSSSSSSSSSWQCARLEGAGKENEATAPANLLPTPRFIPEDSSEERTCCQREGGVLFSPVQLAPPPPPPPALGLRPHLGVNRRFSVWDRRWSAPPRQKYFGNVTLIRPDGSFT